MIDSTDRRYHILKDTGTNCKFFKPELFDDEIRAESLIKTLEERPENNDSE
jgi:hypothetical protein